MSTKDDKAYFECICGEDAIVVDIFDKEVTGESAEVSIAMWNYGHAGAGYGWKNKWYYIKQILKIGHPYTDAVILKKNDVARLIEVLQKTYNKM